MTEGISTSQYLPYIQKMSKEYSSIEMHSAEHLLNQTMVRMFGCKRSMNSHIERKKEQMRLFFGFVPDRPASGRNRKSGQ